MNKVTIDDLLEVGTKVQFKGKRGVIKTAKWVKDQWGDRICLHEVEVQQHGRLKGKRSGETVTNWEDVESYVTPVNYSFLYAL